MKRNKLSVLLLPVLLLAGCGDFPKQARDVIAGAKGFIEKAQANHLQQCQAAPATTICVDINKAVAAQNSAIDALNVYCSGNDWEQGGECKPNKDFEAKARTAVANLDRIIADLKGVIGK